MGFGTGMIESCFAITWEDFAACLQEEYSINSKFLHTRFYGATIEGDGANTAWA